MEDGDTCKGDEIPESTSVASGCHVYRESETATRTVLALGNSHTRQYIASIVPIAEAYDWNIRSVTMPVCTLGREPPYEEWNEDFGCEDVVDGLIAYAKQIKPDAVLTLGTFVYWQDDRIEAVPVGFGEVVREMNAEGIDVIGFRDNPRFQTDPSTCALTEGSEAVECSVSRDLEAYSKR